MAADSGSDYKIFGLGLLGQVSVSIILAALAGWVMRNTGVSATTFSGLTTIFLALIKMVVPPLIFFALVTGFTSMGEKGGAGRVVVKSLIFFLSTACFAVILGLICGVIFKPGQGLEGLLAATQSPTAEAGNKQFGSLTDFFATLKPLNPIKAMAEEQYIQIIYFAFFTGFTINYIFGLARKDPEKNNKIFTAAKRINQFCQDCAPLMFKMIELIVRLAPLAVFGAISQIVCAQGLDVLLSLKNLILAFTVAVVLQYIIFGAFIAFFGRLNPMPFYKKVFSIQAVAFATSSSKATLQYAMERSNKVMGVSEDSSNFVLPLGASINMDGTAIYLGISALFFAQMMNIPLEFHHYLVLLLACTIGSIGAAGIPSGSLIFIGIVMSAIGVELNAAHIGIIAAVDRILDMVRTALNITGDCALTLVIDRSENKTDEALYYDMSVGKEDKA